MQTTTLSKWLVPQQLTPLLRFQCCHRLLFLHLVFCLIFVTIQKYHLFPPLHPPNMVHNKETWFLPWPLNPKIDLTRNQSTTLPPQIPK
jgi:hypothetical protein